jgi:hypothetical protein
LIGMAMREHRPSAVLELVNSDRFILCLACEQKWPCEYAKSLDNGKAAV